MKTKIPRFMKEYAAYQRSIAKQCSFASDIKQIIIQNIEKVLSGYERGLITTNEAMTLLNKANEVGEEV